jgi:hypothetical protein
LLADPDPVKPLLASVTQQVRDALNHLDEQYSKGHEQGMARLEKDAGLLRNMQS